VTFNSIEYLFFFIFVFVLYWFLANKNLIFQNFILLFSSYIFYSFWDWRFLFLLLFSTLLDFSFAFLIQNSNNHKAKRAFLWISIFINVGILCVFKYYNFFITAFIDGLNQIGFIVNPILVNLILPIGISFYTFHGLSYVIDVYKKRILPENSFINYALFVSFFPLLVAGPIERATHLLPQIKKKRSFDYNNASNGLKQIFWGLFKKIIIADNCAIVADTIFDNSDNLSGSTLVLGAIFFAFQIYGDFSGYSDIALGSARLFGIELLQNFSFPYFSRNIPEFWKRWHISLSTWFRDYLYIPLGGSKKGVLFQIRNIFLVFVVSGLWHGANWTFLIWGTLNAFFFIPFVFFRPIDNQKDIVGKGKVLPTIHELIQMISTFSLVIFGWIFFRSENISHALSYISSIFSFSFFSVPSFQGMTDALITIVFLFIFVLIEWFGREGKFALDKPKFFQGRIFRWIFYSLLIFSIGMFWPSRESPFIYFQF